MLSRFKLNSNILKSMSSSYFSSVEKTGINKKFKTTNDQYATDIAIKAILKLKKKTNRRIQSWNISKTRL